MYFEDNSLSVVLVSVCICSGLGGKRPSTLTLNPPWFASDSAIAIEDSNDNGSLVVVFSSVIA